MLRLSLIAPLALVLRCDGGKDTNPKSTDTGADTAADTAGTDTSETGKDTGIDTSDTGHDTGDTQPPPPDHGYFGPPTVLILADDGAGGANAYTLSGPAGPATLIPSLTVSVDSALACAGPFIWVLPRGADSSAPDHAYGVEAHNGSLGKTLELPASFVPRAATYVAGSYWFGGDGSASLVSFADDGTAGPSLDLSSVADGDGLPEVHAFVQTDQGVGAVLAHLQGSTGFGASGFAILDFASATVTSSGTFAGNNAGSVGVSVPGGLLADMSAHGSTLGGIEMMNTTTMASSGNVVSFSGVTRVATSQGGNDGTFWTVTSASGTTTATHYSSDGTSLAAIPTHTETGAFAHLPPNVYSGEGTGASTTIEVYEEAAGTPGGSLALGHTIYKIIACQPPPQAPDTGDTAGP